MPTVRMPNGDLVNFPDDMPKDRIKSLIASKFPEVEQSQYARSAEESALQDTLLEGVTVPNLTATAAGFILVLILSYAIVKGIKKVQRSWPDFFTETLGNGLFLMLILGLFVIGSGRNFEGYEDGDRKGIKITELENKIKYLKNQLIAVSVGQNELKPISPNDLKELATANKANAAAAFEKYQEISQSKKPVKMFYNEKTDGFLFNIEDSDTNELKIGQPMPLCLENLK